ncbi:MAG: hypothetical protein WA188_19870 [Terriglobales bacterium]
MENQQASSKARAVAGWARYLFAWCILFNLLMSVATAQQTGQEPENAPQENAGKEKKESAQEKLKRLPEEWQSMQGKLKRLPIEWLIGPYIPVQGKLQPLTNEQRAEVYMRHTFLTFGSYLARAFSAGIDQARSEPYQWGGGMPGYGKRYVARYGEFVIQNSLASAGDAALGYEPRYDFCRCEGFWPRTRHAISRNFVAYNRSESKLRPQVPLYAGAFTAGILYGSWLPGRHNMWRSGAISMASQAGIGSGYNFVSEFALDILHKFGSKK